MADKHNGFYPTVSANGRVTAMNKKSKSKKCFYRPKKSSNICRIYKKFVTFET